MGSENGISDRIEMKDLIYNLENEDLDNFVNGIVAWKKLGLGKGNPLLLAAEFGCHKILKQIVGIDEDKLKVEERFRLDDCNEKGENILHLGELSISHACCN